jgi:hypothetical protein
MRRAAKSRMTSSPRGPQQWWWQGRCKGCTAGQAEHEGPPQLKASRDGAAHQDGQGGKGRLERRMQAAGTHLRPCRLFRGGPVWAGRATHYERVQWFTARNGCPRRISQDSEETTCPRMRRDVPGVPQTSRRRMRDELVRYRRSGTRSPVFDYAAG